MPTYAPKQESFQTIEPGAYVARIYRFVELGTHESEFKGKKRKTNKVLFSFELPNELKEFKEGEGLKPYSVHARYSMSMFESAYLRIMIDSILGRPMTNDEAWAFDLEQLVGLECMASIANEENNGKTYTNIKGVMRLPKGMTCPPPINKPVVLSFSSWNQEVFESLSDSLKNEIMSSDEYEGREQVNVDLDRI